MAAITSTNTGSTSTPGGAFGDVMSSALGVVSAKVDQWTDKLNDVAAGKEEAVGELADDLAEGGGAQEQAAVRVVEAELVGKNPVWAAVKGAWSGGSTGVKVAIVAAVVALILLVVLAPVLLLILLLTVPIVVVIHKVRSRSH